MRHPIRLFIAASLLMLPTPSPAQPMPFDAEIRAFARQDSVSPPPANPILFVGSSSIRFWSSLAQDFPGKPVLNRGFGGSELSDVIRYSDQIITKYRPKQIVLYAGENDIATGKKTGKQTYERFVTLYKYIRFKLPNTPFVFIAIKPSPSRRQYMSDMNEANRLIQEFLSKEANAEFVDIRPAMLGSNGQPIPALFRPDSLHMLPAGYERWTNALRPVID